MSLYVDRTKKERKKQESGALRLGGLVGAMGLVWLGLVEFGVVWLGMVLSGQVWFVELPIKRNP